jgi:hypothetical protein
VVGCGRARDAAEGWRVGGGQQIGTNDETRGRIMSVYASAAGFEGSLALLV